MLSRYKLLHPQVHDGDFQVNNHTQQLPYATDGSQILENNGVMHIEYCRNHSRDSPSDRRGTQPSDSSRRMDGCAPREADPQSTVLSASTLRGRLELYRCLHVSVHAEVFIYIITIYNWRQITAYFN